jgi:hypothetical protein
VRGSAPGASEDLPALGNVLERYLGVWRPSLWRNPLPQGHTDFVQSSQCTARMTRRYRHQELGLCDNPGKYEYNCSPHISGSRAGSFNPKFLNPARLNLQHLTRTPNSALSRGYQRERVILRAFNSLPYTAIPSILR